MGRGSSRAGRRSITARGDGGTDQGYQQEDDQDGDDDQPAVETRPIAITAGVPE